MMMLLGNLFLAFAWSALAGGFTLGNLVVGFVLGYCILYFVHAPEQRPGYLLKLPKALALLGTVTVELVKANLRVAHVVVTTRQRAQPAVVAVPLDVRSDSGILLLSIMITLTPDTLALELSPDRSTLLVYSLFMDDPVEVRSHIKKTFERPVMELDL